MLCLKDLNFLEGHPQQHSHVLVQRAQPALPRFISGIPVRPEATADVDARERWAAWALAISPHTDRIQLPQHPFMTRYWLGKEVLGARGP
jgi:hypothetical protein